VDFLKWKAPIVNWIFASIFIASRFFGDKPAIEHMMGHAINAPKEVWMRLNTIWIFYFIVLGAINLAVAFLLSEALWIQFKVFGNLILTFAFIIGQMPLLASYIEVEEEPEANTSDNDTTSGLREQ
jgi:intracellular septation protein